MSFIHSLCALFAFLLIILHLREIDFKKIIFNPFFIIIIFGIIVRCFALSIDLRFESDINCFKGWSTALFENGFSSFYSSDMFTDYPPGYMYILWILGGIKTFLNLDGFAFTVLIMMPAIICDIVAACLIYKLASTKIDKNLSLFFAMLYVLNPAIIINSSMWGQVDSVHTLFIFLSLYFLTQKKYTLSFPIFAYTILIKPQALMFSPIYLYFFFSFFIKEKKENSIKDSFCTLFKEMGPGIGISLVILILLLLPFADKGDFSPIINQYINTLASYPHATVNAYNIYALNGLNWAPLDSRVLGIPVNVLGYGSIVIITFISFFFLYKNSKDYNVFFTAAFLNSATYMFSVKMHDRYIFPVLLLLLVSYILQKNKKILFLYIGFSITVFLNCLDILRVFNQNSNYEIIKDSMPIISAVNMILIFALIFIGFTNIKPIKITLSEKDSYFSKWNLTENFSFTKYDIIFICLLTFLYSIFAFAFLGNLNSPQTVWHGTNSEPVVVEIPDENISRIMYLNEAQIDNHVKIYSSDDGVSWKIQQELLLSHVFAWREQDVDINCRYIKIEPFEEYVPILEMAFFNEFNNIIPVNVISKTGHELFDEQVFVPDAPSYMNSTYFDEIYHPRTAYEFVQGLSVYEWTHPPLGKVIIAAGIKLFGMTPFGWRFMGTLFGVLMVPLMYLFARRMFKNSFWALFASFIFSFDFMHFTQTRLATIDTYVTFFIILMYYFMYLYYSMDLKNNSLKKSLPLLLLSGISMGLAIACKWQGVYAAAGIAVIFFYKLYLEIKKHAFEEIKNKIFITIGMCFIFFVFIPILIYIVSYIPYLYTEGADGFNTILKNQKDMFNYHSQLESTHPYSSPWWSWPFILKPIFYYSSYYGDVRGMQIKSGISSFGNPAVWWMGIIAFFYTIKKKKEDSNSHISIFLLIAFASQILPWVPVSRTTFIYHFFPSVPFIVLMVTSFFKNHISKINIKLVFIYMIVVLILFLMFYPVLSGLPIPKPYVDIFLRWLPSWVLI